MLNKTLLAACQKPKPLPKRNGKRPRNKGYFNTSVGDDQLVKEFQQACKRLNIVQAKLIRSLMVDVVETAKQARNAK